ncbi:MAG: AbrB/MazE/SpoVT family DNA-binding domain-containing protein [archaeon]
MAKMAMTRLSSKGQIVLPVEIRKGFSDGTEFVLIRDKDDIVIRRADKATKRLLEDLEFARRTEKAWKQITSGNYIELSEGAFKKKLRKWVEKGR